MQHELLERLQHLVAVEVEDVLDVVQIVALDEQRPELADLVVPGGQEPVVAVELVLLDVREHRPREPQQLVERAALLVGELLGVALREPVALARQLLGRALLEPALARAR